MPDLLKGSHMIGYDYATLWVWEKEEPYGAGPYQILVNAIHIRARVSHIPRNIQTHRLIDTQKQLRRLRIDNHTDFPGPMG